VKQDGDADDDQLLRTDDQKKAVWTSPRKLTKRRVGSGSLGRVAVDAVPFLSAVETIQTHGKCP